MRASDVPRGPGDGAEAGPGRRRAARRERRRAARRSERVPEREEPREASIGAPAERGEGAARGRTLSIALVVALATFAAHARSLGQGFLGSWDDGANLLDNPHFRGFDAERLGWMFTTFHMGPYQPLSWLSYAVDHALGGLEPRGYHLTSVLLHALTAGLFFLFARELFHRALPAGDARCSSARLELAAALAALLFSLHPLRVESVAWATERRDVLSGAFFVAALLVWLRGVGPDGYLRRRALLGALALALAAMLSKGTTVVLPAAMLAADVWPLKRFRAGLSAAAARRALIEKIPFLALALAFSALAVLGQREAGALAERGIDAGDRAQIVLRAAVFYPFRTLLPFDLAPLYEVPLEWRLDAELVAGGAFLAGLIALSLAFARRFPALLAALAAYALILLPVSGLLQSGSQWAADRYSYLACMPFALLAGGWLLAGRAPLARGAILAAAAAALAALTWRQTGIWRDDMTLWTAAIEHRPRSAIAHSNRGALLLEAGRLDQAEADLRRAVELWPYADALNNLASLWNVRGEAAAAEEAARRALEADPALVKAHRTRGIALVQLGRAEEAAAELALAVGAEPRDGLLRSQLAGALLAARRTEEALAEARRAAQLAPGDAAVAGMLAFVLLETGRREEALEAIERTIALDPRSADNHCARGDVLRALGRLPEAAAAYRRALELEPTHEPARRALAEIAPALQ